MNNYKKIVQTILMLIITISLSAQKSEIYTNNLKEYNHAIELYQNKAYVASQQKFEKIKNNFDNLSELKYSSNLKQKCTNLIILRIKIQLVLYCNLNKYDK